jgi:DNA-binding protein H-NS
LTIDELWLLPTEVDQILAARLAAEKRELEKRLDQLGQGANSNEPAKNSPAKQSRLLAESGSCYI